MSAILFQPCGDVFNQAQFGAAIGDYPHTISINEAGLQALRQLNQQLQTQSLACPLCKRKVEYIDTKHLPNQKYPLSCTTIRHLKINTMSIDLHIDPTSATKTRHVVNFTRIDLQNIVNEGRDSIDGGRTFRHLANLSNDYNALLSSQGSIMGRILYWMPTSWKAGAYIRVMEKDREEQKPSISWLLTDAHGQTIGIFGLSKIKNEDFALKGEHEHLKLYNVGVFLHSNFQRRGVVTALTNQLFEQIAQLQLDIDALWVMTLPTNTGVNYIANKLNFTFLKRYDFRHPSFFPCCSESTTTLNLYVKPLQARASV